MRKRIARRFLEENGDAEDNDVSVRGRGDEVFRRCLVDVEVLRFRARAMGGKGAELLGLRGDVHCKDFIALASN